MSVTLPYIVYSRRDPMLLKRLTETDAPILFEGVHTTYYMSRPELKNRFKAVRIHNIEHAYYQELYKKESQLAKKAYYQAEAILLKTYEAKLQTANAFFALSMADTNFFKAQYPAAIHEFVGPFQAYDKVESKEGAGTYALYHGNLSHPENKEAALFLLKEVVPQLNIPFIIAGKDPADEIVKACLDAANCKLVANPAADEMKELIADAQVHVLPTFQATGMKLKLLHALFKGRHVVVNSSMLHGTGLENICLQANTAGEFIDIVNNIINIPLSPEQIQKRTAILSKNYSNRQNAEKLVKHLLR